MLSEEPERGVIYKKTYPEILSKEEIEEILANTPPSTPEELEKLHKLLDNVGSVPICSKLDKADRFIELAKKLSEDFETDIEIIVTENEIMVKYRLVNYFEYTWIPEIAVMADSISCNPSEECTELCLHYETHTMVHKHWRENAYR